jgi:hypothetical protein
LNWTILWQIDDRAATEIWNVAIAQTEAGALDRAKHFIALGFPVYAIRNPTGGLFMDQAQIAERFGVTAPPAPELDAFSP